MCLNPKPITNHGRYKENTYRGKKGDEYCIETFTKCGRCPQCIAEKSNNWVIRNNYEVRAHEKICFITLTYEKCLPFLVKEDFQKFMKRLRRHLEYHNIIGKKDKIRAFINGEYGTLYHRPHGHIIIYGWEETKNNLEFLEINKKGNIVLQSKTIQEVWGLGRTTYQIFNPYEIPYISLYNTPSEEIFKGYILTKQKYNELKEKYKNNIKKGEEKRKEFKRYIKDKKKNTKKYFILYNQVIKNLERWKQLLKDLKELQKIIDNEKTQAICIKEFNTWSKAMGWEEFEKEYKKYKNNYDFTEYIEDKQFLTPTSWVKKLANNGDEHAIKEMLCRTAELESRGNAFNLESENRIKYAYKTINEKIKYQKNKDNIIL